MTTPGGLFSDLYEFTMAQSYLEHDVTETAVFDLHTRSLPDDRGFMVTSGVQTLLDRLEHFTFDEDDLAFLAEQGLSDELVDYLREFSFEGQIRAIPEGRVAFPYEPLLQIEAPLPMAQLVETLVINTIHVETVIATKAARCYEAIGAPDAADEVPTMVDFGARRAHGPDASRAAARASYIAGFAGTSLVDAARDVGIPCFGTMAHSYVEAFAEEREALASFARSFPDGTTLLIDTYDTIEGAHLTVDVATELAEEGVNVGGVRIDSGDLAEQAQRVRSILDEAGLHDVRIILSGGLDEHAITSILDEGAPVDGFGVGTSMVTSKDAPSLDLSYKLVEYGGDPVLKTSPGKRVLPRAKQVYRRGGDELAGDTITRVDEQADGQPLLESPERLSPDKATQRARERFLDEIQRVPDEVRNLHHPSDYPVASSEGLETATQRALDRVDGDRSEPDVTPI